MRKLYAATFLVVFFVMLPKDSAICAGGGSGANGSKYTHAKVQVPSEPGEPFLLDEKIGGIEDSERQIYKQGTSPNWSHQIPKLPDLIDEALRRNPTTRQIWEMANASAASLAAAKGAYWPPATVASATKPSYARTPTFPGYLRTTELDYNPTLQVQYLLFDFGGREASVDAARFTFFASEFAINQTLQTVVVGVLKGYYTLVQAKESIAIANQSLERAERIIKDIEASSSAAKDVRTDLIKNEKDGVKDLTKALEEDQIAGGILFVGPAAQEELKKLKSTQANLDQQKGKIQSLDEQKKLVEPNLSSFKLGVEVATGAVAAAKIQLASSIGLPGNTPLNADTLPVSSLPQASLFSKEDFIGKDNLIKKLTEGQGEVSKFLWENFRSDNQDKLKQPIAEQQLSILAAEFNRVAERRVSIDNERDGKLFAGVKLRDETRDLKAESDGLRHRGRRPEAWLTSRLNRLLLEDAYPDELEKSLLPTNGPPIEELPETVDNMIVEALRSRPDIANKYFSYRSARALARQADSNVYPNLAATFTGSTTAFDRTVRNDQVSGAMETSNSGRADNFLGALTVTIPVFDALTLVNKARAARKTADAARADLANSELNAISDVATNFEAYRSAVEQYKLATMLVVVAADALKTAENGYTDALADYKKSPENPKEDDCEKEKGPCAERKKQEKLEAALSAPREKLQNALNALVAAQSGFDGAATKWSSTKLSVVTSSFQLANAIGALLPKYRSAANPLNPLPVRPTDRR